MAHLLSMEGIEKSFFGVSVLKGVDFDLEHGEVHVLLGENGAGKSTLMKILSGAYTLDAGTITLDGQSVDLSDYDPRKAEDLGIVTIYQNFHLIPDLSVAENLSLTQFHPPAGFHPLARGERPCARGAGPHQLRDRPGREGARICPSRRSRWSRSRSRSPRTPRSSSWTSRRPRSAARKSRSSSRPSPRSKPRASASSTFPTSWRK